MKEIVAAWKKARLIIFDFDGVLADSEPFHREAYNKAFTRWNHSIDENEYWEFWTSKGQGVEGEISRHNLKSIDPELVIREKRKIYSRMCHAGTIPLFPQAASILTRMISETISGSKPSVVIASNTSSTLVEAVLRHGGAPVPAITGGENLPPKPAPDIFLRAASSAGFKPEESLILEDAEKGLTAAKKGGFPVIVIRNRLNRDLDLKGDWELKEGLAGVSEILDRLVKDRQ